MFTVVGSYAAGVAYTVTVGDDGTLTGSPRLVEAVRAADGEQMLATPTGPAYTLSPGDPESTWVWLAKHTRIVETVGELPIVVPPRTPGTIY